MMQHQGSTLGARAMEALGQETYSRQLALRRRILAVAKHRFARFGIEGASLDVIARDADVSPVELLTHFDNKTAILTAILDEGWDSINQRLADIILNSLSARNAMLAMLALMMNVMQKDEDLTRLLLLEGRRPDPESSEVAISDGYRQFILACENLIVRGQRDGSFKPSYHPRVVTSMLIGAIEGIMRDRMLAMQENSLTPYTGSYLISAFDGLVSYLGRSGD
jgi:AcrR family transcriptional regulator